MTRKWLISCLCCLFATTFKSQTVVYTPSNNSTEIAFASDTQAPLWVEKLFLKAHNNRTATKLMFKDITERRPVSLFLLGDVVSLGSSNRSWKEMDKYLDKCRGECINVYGTMGNHEVMGTGKMGKKGQQKFQKYFPEHLPTGFAQIIDSVAVILLNSNFSSLSKAEDAQQIMCYKELLTTLDTDPSIQYIISGCHHSPYSNSKIVGSSKTVQQKFVPLFMRSKKSRLFLSGHSHNFEHFKKNGKDFLVIGGGGGLHQPLNSGGGDLSDIAPDYKPKFHYLTVRRLPDQLVVTSYKLKDDFTGFTQGLLMNINRPEIDL